MKSSFYNKTMGMLAVALVAAMASICRAQDQAPPPPAGDAALPPEIEPNTPLAQVVKLVQAGVDMSLVNNFIATSQSPFNLDADKIMALTDLGVPKAVINAMLDRDKALYLAANLPVPAETAPPASPDTSSDTAPDTTPAPVTVDYFNDTLAPYGSWVDVDGYGRCWRPTVVIYDTGWHPYCDRGHWVYTDCGWYWDSDYSWGVTFHYGRWFRDGRFGWCWYPDTDWAPSWVTWRSSDDYCGWAPLPPLAVYRPGAGFYYRGAAVAVGFDFGLGADSFSFVAPAHFLENHPRRFSVDAQHVPQVFVRTTIINNFDSHNQFVVNNGIPAARVGALMHRPIQAVRVGSLPNAGREGWRGTTSSHPVQPVQHGSTGNNNPARYSTGGNNQVNHTATGYQNGNNNAGHPVYGNTGQTVNHQAGSPYVAPHPENTETTINRNESENRPVVAPKSYEQQTQPRYTAPVEPEHSTPPVEQRQVEQRQNTEPSQPAESERVQQSEERPSHVEQAPHNPPAAAPAENQQHNPDKDQNGH